MYTRLEDVSNPMRRLSSLCEQVEEAETAAAGLKLQLGEAIAKTKAVEEVLQKERESHENEIARLGQKLRAAKEDGACKRSPQHFPLAFEYIGPIGLTERQAWWYSEWKARL